MASNEEYSDTLRALGRFLDEAQAQEIEISGHADGWTATWENVDATRFTPIELEDLRSAARRHRGLEGDLPRFTTSQMLRVLGDILDDLHPTRFTIEEIEDGYRVTCFDGDKESVATFSLDEIRELVARRLEER